MLLMIYGDDEFSVKEKARDFVSKFVAKYDPSCLNVDEFVFRKKDDVDISDVSEAIGSSPFLSTKRMVRIDGIFSCVTTKPEAEPWVKLFENIPESTVVILVDAISPVKLEKIELGKRLTVADGVLKYPFPLLSGADLRAWVIERAKVRGATFVPAVADYLIVMVGNDTWRLDSEIAKLSAYAGESPVTNEMIGKLTVREYKDDMFAFVDAMSTGKPAYAIKKLDEERLAGAEDFPIFGMLTRQIRLLLQVKVLCEDQPSVTKQIVSERLGIHPFVAQKLLAEASRRSLSSLESVHSQAVLLDLAMKRGLDAGVAVDRLVIEMLDVK